MSRAQVANMGRGGKRFWLAGGVLSLLLGFAPLSCRSTEPSAPPIAPDASTALAEARRIRRVAAPGWEDGAREAARRAAALEPDWVAPERFLDDLARRDLVAHASLAARLDALADPIPEDGSGRRARARNLYLAGRLEGEDGTRRFSLALALDPNFAWAQHGVGWMGFLAHGPGERALRAARRAEGLARESFERATFAVAELRYLLARDEPQAGVRRGLRALAEVSDLTPEDRAELTLWTVRAELSVKDPDVSARGFWRGVDLLRDVDLNASQVTEAVSILSAASRSRRGGRAELESALSARDGAARRSARARLLDTRSSLDLALSLYDASEAGTPLSLAFQTGEGPNQVQVLTEQITQALSDHAALEVDPRIEHVVEVARSGDEAHLASTLLDAGWFEEARNLAVHIARTDPEEASRIDRRATAGLALLEGIHGLLERVDAGRELDPWNTAGGEAAADPDLDGLLHALQGLFDRYGESVGLAPGSFDLAATPRSTSGGVATILHPGPRFSALDAKAGRGEEGESVPGLAAALASIGRFGVFGSVLGGGGPDGTVLRLIALEEREGEILGRPYHGTVAWCFGTDVPSRPARHGAGITGAALHEGFWIDIAGVRVEFERWRDLRDRFFSDGGERGTRALEAAGPRLLLDEGASESQLTKERARVYAPLGEADRVRLASLLSRGERGVNLGDLLEVTAAHEEGHLVDRSRFLPISAHLGAGLRLLVSVGFRPDRLARILEYRAELMSLLIAEDPRLPLADILDGAEGGGTVTEHAAAYRELLGDLLAELEAMRAAGELECDADRYLIHQLHRLGPEVIRTAAELAAKKKGL